MTEGMTACWCDDKSKEPCEGICRLMRDNERLGAGVGRLAMENAALRVAESHQLASARADLTALREAAQAVVEEYGIWANSPGMRDRGGLIGTCERLRAVLASA